MASISIPNSHSHDVKNECWQLEMREELNGLNINHMWDIVPYLDGIKPVGCKWVYSNKLKFDGSLDCYKAHLAALGKKQEYRIKYEKTFASITKMTTKSILLLLVHNHGRTFKWM